MPVFSGKTAKIYKLAGVSAASTPSALGMTAVAGTTNLVWRLTGKSNVQGFLDPNKSITVLDNAEPVSPSQYSIQHAAGQVTFTVAPVGPVTIVGSYYTASEMGNAKSWSLEVKVDTLEDTVFGSTWKTFQPAIKGGTVSLAQWWADGFFLTDLAPGDLLGLVLELDSGVSYNLYAALTGDSVKVAADALVEESLDLEVSGAVSPFGM